MKFPIFVVLATLVTFLQAMPVSENPVDVLVARTRNNKCKGSTFTGHTGSGSPLSADCKVIIRNISGGGTWTLFGGFHRTLVTYRSCALGAESESGVVIGNQDIIDLINESINRFGNNGKVGAAGKMPCFYSKGSYAPTNWSIYHT